MCRIGTRETSSWIQLFLLAGMLLSLAGASSGQEVPLEHCDQLPLIRVQAERPMLFLIDTGATSILNLKSFPPNPREDHPFQDRLSQDRPLQDRIQDRVSKDGSSSSSSSKDLKVTSWSGTVATRAREIRLPKMTIGSYQLAGLELPAIDLSSIGKACGKPIDGILGSDLLEKMGAAIDFKRQVVYFTTLRDRRTDELIVEMTADINRCVAAFNESDDAGFGDCLDPQIVFHSLQGDLYGSAPTLSYFKERYFQGTPAPHLELHSSHFHAIGNSLWFTYDFTLSSRRGGLQGTGMAMCRKSEGHWRIASLQHVLSPTEAPANKK